jgi:uncharacterized protein
MKLEQSFEVAAPLQRVWDALIDVERVAPCLPGAAVTGRNEDGSYAGTFKVKIGPTTAAYSGKLSMHNVDEQDHSATMDAQGTDRRGQGGAKATIVSKLSPAGDQATRVEVVTDYHITGRLARFGRGGMIEDISNRLLGEFASCLQTSLAGEPSEPAAAAAGAPTPPPESAVDPEPAVEPEQAVDPEQAVEPEPEPRPQTATEEVGSSPPATPAPVSQTPPPESEPVHGLTLMASVLWSRAKRNPAPVAAVVFGFLLALRIVRRGK